LHAALDALADDRLGRLEPHLSGRVSVLTRVQIRHWRFHMLNPWLAITFQTMRLGFEAQNAVTLRLMRLVGDASKTEARSMLVDKAATPPDAQEAATKVASDSDREREAVTKVHKKRVRANKRRHSK
jgi:hypothetical protein